MPYYRKVGEIPPKRHTQFRSPTGSLYAEELMGVEGFSSDSALLYHQNLPTAIVNAEVVADERGPIVANHPLKPRAYRTQDLKFSDGADAVTGRRRLFGNNDVTISFAVASAPSPLYRNAAGDELLYIQGGSGTVETSYGSLEVSDGDYVVLPTSTTYRVVPGVAQGSFSTNDSNQSSFEPLRVLSLEARGHIGPPRRYLSSKGQFLEHAPYCERDQRGPSEPLVVEGGDTDVLVRHRAGLTRFTYDHHPFDVVGWDGCLYPWAFNIADFEPLTGRVHQPPPVHQTFEGPNFVVCSFCPRKVDYHPLAIPVPYNHANVDSDELMFYVRGDYEARKGSGIDVGSMSLHPSGCTHGPQPGAAEGSIGAEFFDETAVMVDTFAPLELGEAANECEDPNYAWTWSGRPPSS